MGRLTRSEIIKQYEAGRLVLDPFKPENVGPNSVDLTLGKTLLWHPSNNSYGHARLDMKRPPVTQQVELTDDGFWMVPGRLYLGVTTERAGSDFYATTIAGRSSVGRLGLFVHVTAGFGDLGFKGCWTLELICHHPLRIYPGVRICQVAFDEVTGDIDHLYDREHHHKYGRQWKSVPVASQLYKDFEEAANA